MKGKRNIENLASIFRFYRNELFKDPWSVPGKLLILLKIMFPTLY
jgi:hypothetical protein